MWKATTEGKELSFRLGGLNNQNFIMRDEQTGSWWQQVTGRALLGPLAGKRLVRVFHDELTFAAWRREHPEGRVLRPDPDVAEQYASANWEEEVAAIPVPPTATQGPLEPRELVIGIAAGGESRAYRFSDLRAASPIIDRLGDVSLLVVLGADGKSVRAFDRTVGGEVLEFFAEPGHPDLRLIDSATGSEWDFSGRAVAGELAGRRLRPVPVLPEFWFDWRIHHPKTDVHSAGLRRP